MNWDEEFSCDTWCVTPTVICVYIVSQRWKRQSYDSWKNLELEIAMWMSFDRERHKECDKTVCCGEHSLGNFKNEWISREGPQEKQEKNNQGGDERKKWIRRRLAFQAKGNTKYSGLRAADMTRQISMENHLLILGIMRSLTTFAIGVSAMCSRLQSLKNEWVMSKWKESVD